MIDQQRLNELTAITELDDIALWNMYKQKFFRNGFVDFYALFQIIRYLVKENKELREKVKADD